MLDIPRLERLRLTPRPLPQRLAARLVGLSFATPPRVRIEFEGLERVPNPPVIFAMNHTDRYNYFPFLHRMALQHDRYMATWVKGKYYENAFVGGFMEKTNQLPTVSRGYLITRDFLSAVGRTPTEEEYSLLRRWVDTASTGAVSSRPDPTELPSQLLERPRNVLGRAYEPDREDYAGYINTVFAVMMRRFVALNAATAENGLDLLIFPQGTRSVRLLPSHIGISQIALFLERTIVPVGCMGCDLIYPGVSPWARGGRALYRFGHPITYQAMRDFHIEEKFEPFAPEAERRYRYEFEGLAELVTERINAVLDEPYRADGDSEGQALRQGIHRFI